MGEASPLAQSTIDRVRDGLLDWPVEVGVDEHRLREIYMRPPGVIGIPFITVRLGYHLSAIIAARGTLKGTAAESTLIEATLREVSQNLMQRFLQESNEVSFSELMDGFDAVDSLDLTGYVEPERPLRAAAKLLLHGAMFARAEADR